jgi:trans-aconitate methyltransferase
MSTWNSSLYDDKHGFVSALGADLIDLLDPKPGERVLDLGCGTGHLATQIAQRGASVAGFDASESMIRRAQAAYPEIEFCVRDASDFHVEQPFDAIFSNAALHWVLRAEDAARCIARALRHGGRLVLEMGGRGNVAHIERAIRGVAGLTEAPWYFPSVGEYASILERHGLEVVWARLFDRPTPLEGEDGLRNWVAMFGSATGARIGPAEVAEIERQLRPQLWDGQRWIADYRRLRLVALRTA